MITRNTHAPTIAAAVHSNVSINQAGGDDPIFRMPHSARIGGLMSSKEIAELRREIHALDMRVVRLETTVKVAIGLLGLLEVVLKIWSLLPGGH